MHPRKPSFQALGHSLSRHRSVFAISAALALASPARAATVNWDPAGNQSNSGGTGTWDLSSLFWNDDNIAPDLAWPNLADSVAVFGGTGGAVNITTGTGVTANGLVFNASGYTIGSSVGGDVLNLAGTAPALTVTNALDSATIGSSITGSGFTKNGLGTLVLSGANTYTGETMVTTGTLSISSDANLGTVANGLTLDGGTLLSSGTFTTARLLTLGGAGGTLNVTAATTLTFSSALAGNANALIKTGPGTLTLQAASGRSGTTLINAGGLSVTAVNALGTGAVTVTGASSIYEINTAATTSTQLINLDNGGTLQWTQAAQLTLGPAVNVTGTGGTLFVGGTGSVGKVLAAGGLLTSSAGSTLTKTGGGVLQTAGANPGFLGDVSLQAGTIEFQNADALGLAVKTITVGGTGDFALNSTAVTARHNFVLNTGGTLSANGTVNSVTYGGGINVAGNANIALRYFQAVTTADGFTISGPLSGAGNLAVTAPAAATLTLTGNNTAYSGSISAGPNATVLATTKQTLGTGGFTLAGGTVRILAQDTNVTLGANGLNATYYNFGTNPGVASAQFAGDLLYLTPRAFSRVDAQTNVPNAGGGDLPIVPVPGFGIGTGITGAINDGYMWKGLLNITNPGSYQFKGTDDDALTLYIDGVQVGSLGVIATVAVIGTPVALSAGSHSIVIKHTNGTGGGYGTVLYNGGAGSDAPADQLLGATPGSVTTGSLGALALGPVTTTATSTLDLLNDATTSALSLGNGTLTITSQTLSKLVAASGTLTGAPTIAVQNNSLTFAGGIGQSAPGLGLNLSGPGLTEFQGANTYTGNTTVTGGQLRLNKSGLGDAIAGDLTINAPNANGDIANVRLMQSNQIADTSFLTMTSGILDLGANNDTIGFLAMGGGRIIGSGTLTVGNLGLFAQTGGIISANLAGAGGLLKNTAGTLALGGANTYAGVTNINLGTLKLQGGSLGAGDVGNETNVGVGQLFITNTNSGTESVNVNNNTGIRVAGGTATLGTLNFTASATAPVALVDAGGELILNTALTSTAPIAKEGRGTLTFNYNVGATLPANVLLNAGALGFNGVQSFGAATIPAGRAFKFNSDPLGGVNITAPTGTSVIAGYAAADQLLPRINAASAGALVLGVDSGAALNFSLNPTLSLGGLGLRTFSGALTPGASGYRLGGGGGELTVTTALSGTNDLTINQSGTVILRGAKTFTGTTTIDGGGRLRLINNDELGTATNGVTLSNGGTLELIGSVHDVARIGAVFSEIGNPLNAQQRTITVGSGGGTLNAVSYSNLGNAFALSGVNALTGSGTLTKTGYGEIMFMSSSNFSGNLILAGESGRFQIRSTGALPNVASVTVGQGSDLLMNDNGALGQRQFPLAVNGDRLNDAASITLAGGALSYISSVAGTTETVGAVTLNTGRDVISSTRNGGTGAQLTITNLIRPFGGGVVRFGTGGTALLYGTTGDNSRVLFNQINGVAPTAGVVLPWATVLDDGFAVHGGGAFIGVNSPTGTAVGTGAFSPVAGTLYNFNTAVAATTLTLASGPQSLAGFRFGNGAFASSLLFTSAATTLFVGEGVIISDNQNVARTIGAAATPGLLTAGISGAAAGPRELFFHVNQNILGVESIIVDNNGAVTVEKGTGGGTLELRNGSNSYSGGTIVQAGRVNALVAGSLGSGPVTVKGASLEIRQPGVTTSTLGITASDRSEVYLQNLGAVYNQPGDRFTLVGDYNSLTGGNATAGGGLNSLTRVSTITGPGQVVLPANSIIRTTNAPNGVVDVNMPLNLGTNADLYFNNSGGGGLLQSITVGAGTPWKGLCSGVSATSWSQGTINANSDFSLQGMNRLATNIAYTLGSTGTVGGWTINNLAGKPINAFIEGQVVMAEDAPMALPSDLTFVVTPGGQLVVNISQSLGADSIGLSRSKVLVQGGGVLNPGAFVSVGAAVNQPFGMPYPIPSPLNAFTTVEAGGRFSADDTTGLGSTTGGATWTMKKDSILWVSAVGAFLGSNNGLINNNQFVYEPGAIFRMETDRIFRLDHAINAQTGGEGVVIEIFNGNRNITDYVDLFNAGGAGVTTVKRQVITLGAGGGITNDAVDRTVNDRRGQFVLNNGATLSATTQTGLFFNESFNVAPGATINIGSAGYIDGLPKNGLVQFGSAASVAAGAGATFNVLAGGELSFGAVHVFPDTASLNLVAPVDFTLTAGATTPYIGNGSSLLLNTANYLEIIGPLTGNGAVFSQQDGSALGAGWGATSDFTFDGQFRSTTFTTRSPALVKVGPTRMTLTGTSDTPTAGATNSPGSITAYQGEIALAGPNGKWNGGELRIARGGILTFDNSGTAITDRQGTGGTGNRWLTTMGGGDFRLLGNATQAADVIMFGLGNSAGSAGFGMPAGNTGGFGTVTVVPAGDATLKTSLTFGTFERFDNAGTKNSVWLIRGPGTGGLPGTYDPSGFYTPNVANPGDGLTFITTPNLYSGGIYGAAGSLIFGGIGTPVTAVRGDLLATTSLTATSGEFATIDIASGFNRTGVRALQPSEYAPTTIANANQYINVRTSVPLNFNSGTTQFQVIKLENGGSLNVSGVLPFSTQPAQIVLSAGGIFVPAGATASITASGNTLVRTAGGVAAYIHAFGNLTVNGTFFSDVGIVKTGPGTVTFATGSLLDSRGRLTIHEGTVNINDTLPNIRQTSGWTGPALALNGGTLNLNGRSQLFGLFESGNILPGASTEGGTLTSATPATVSIQGGGTFSGHINGAIALDKVGNNNLLLTNTNATSGNLSIRQGALILRDSGTLSNVTTIDLNYARLDIDNGYLSAQNSRLNPNVTLNLRGADFVNRGRAATLTQETIGTLNLLQGHNLMQTLAGGGGATETLVNTLNRSAGATVSFQQNFGFIGTAGNDTSAIRVLVNNISVNGAAALTPAALMAANNGILGGWAIVNNDHFATYQVGKGISYLSNTEDGFLNYGGTDLSTANATTGTLNYNDATTRAIAAGAVVNSIRNTGAQTMTLAGGLTINSGGLLTNGNNAVIYNGGTITSNSGELNVFVQQSTTTINSVIVGNIALTKAGAATLTLGGNNTYTGITYVGQGSTGSSTPSGTLNVGVTGANGTTIVAIPGNLQIHSSTVTVTVEKSIKETSTVTLLGGAILNMRDADNATESLFSLIFSEMAGDNANRPIVTRAAARPTSFLNLTAPTAITVNNLNSTSVPAISVNLGTVNFTNAAGAQTLLVNSPISTVGNAATGLLFNANIGTVPLGIPEGGLIKAGTGMLVLGSSGTTQFGNPLVNTEVFNIQAGSVRVDNANALGPVNAITTVQNGAALFLNTATGITGSVRLKNGSRMGATITGSLLGAVGSTGFLDIPAGAAVQIDAFDSFVPTTNTGNVTVNHLLTGSGTINQVGISYVAGYNGGGILDLRNTGNTFSGTFNVGTNAVLVSDPNNAALSGNTLGTATINLNGGVLRVRDAGNGFAGAETIPYGNNVRLSANSFIDVDRLGAATGKTIAFGTLTVAAGTQALMTVYSSTGTPTGNGYSASFNQVDGPGTLLKAGQQIISLNGFASTFTGNIQVAGALGLNVQASSNLNFNAPDNNLPGSLLISGIQQLAAFKNLTVGNTLEVGSNPGSVSNGLNGVSSGAVTGYLSIPGGAVVGAGLVRNNGQIGAVGSLATLNAGTFVGNGIYQTSGQPLTLQGNLADDGATATRIKVAGDNVVTLTAASSVHSGGAEVQSGVLRLAPSSAATNPLGNGSIRVVGFAASSPTGDTNAVAASSGELRFDSGSNALSQTGNITNSGLVHVSSGTTTIPGVISGPGSVTYLPGLLEGRLNGALNSAGQPNDYSATRPGNNGNFGLRSEPRFAQQNLVTQNPLTGWSDNDTWVYTGQFFDADGKFSFAENIDDNTFLAIDGVVRLASTQYNQVSSTAYAVGQTAGVTGGIVNNMNSGSPVPSADFGMGPNGDGWHNIEIRLHNGTGGAGPVPGNGFFNNFGLGLNTTGAAALDGSQYVRPIDPGDGTVFRTAINPKGSIAVEGASTLNVGQVTNTATLTLAAVDLGAGAVANMTGPLSGSSASVIDNVVVTGTTGSATLSTGASSSLSVGAITVPSGLTLTHSGTTNRLLITGSTTGGGTLNSTGTGVTFNSNTAQSVGTSVAGTGGLIKQGTGTLTLDTRATYSGATQITAGTLKTGAGFTGTGGTGGAFDTVPETANYKLLYSLPITDSVNYSTTVPYTVDHSTDGTIAGGFTRVAYYLELQQAGQPLQYVYASFDAGKFQLDLTKLGVPTAANGEFYHYDAAGLLPGQIRNMNVASNVAGITTGAAITTGNAEFWPSNYTQANDYGVPGANAFAYDFGDGGANGTTTGHGSIQIHNYATGETLFAINQFNSFGSPGLGIGNQLGGDTDYTFAGNAFSYTVKNFQVYVGNLTPGTSGGFLPIQSPFTISAGAVLDISNGAEQIGSLAGAGSVLLGTSSLSTGTDNTNTAFSGSIAGAGSLAKIGTGTWTLSGANPYTGATTVSAGALLVSGSIDGTTGVNVLGGATLGGSGSITTTGGGNVSLAAGAQLSPGLNAKGTLTLSLGLGHLALAGAVDSLNSHSLLFELGSVATSDRLLISTGVLDIGAGVLGFDDFTFTGLAGFGAGTYTLFDSSSPILGSFAANLTGTINGLNASLSMADSNHDLILVVLPEPNSVALLGGAALMLGLRRFRRLSRWGR